MSAPSIPGESRTPSLPSSRIVVSAYGGPDSLSHRMHELPPPEAGTVRVLNAASGVNFIDVYHRTGYYERSLPFVPGVEGAGTVLEFGPGTEDTGLRPGDPVGYIGAFGSYAQHSDVPVQRLIPLPADIDLSTAAAVLLHGLTAYALLHDVHAVQPGETVLIHAAAGGLGQVMCQWAAGLGATVIGAVSTDAKAAVAGAAGCQHTVLTTDPGWPAAVRGLSDGGVPAVYDSVGKDTFAGSLDCLRTRGLLVSLGQSSGPPSLLDVPDLGHRGSLSVTRPSVFHFVEAREQLLRAAEAVFAAMRTGLLRPTVEHTYPLADAASAHGDLEGRRTTGPIVLLP